MAQSLQAAAAPGQASTPPAAGHNKPPLTREEKNALLVRHIGLLRAQQAEIEKARAPFQAAQATLTDLINTAKGDLGKAYSRKHLIALCEDVGTRLRDLAREEEQRFHDRQALGLPVFGVQQDLFGGGGDAMPEEAKDEIAWEADGYLAGRRGDSPTAPEGCPPRMDQAFMRGYNKGVEENGKLLAQAGEIAKARNAPPPKPKAEEPDPGDPAELKKAAERLKANGFTKKGGSAPEQAAA